jgi:hypothetical protein
MSGTPVASEKRIVTGIVPPANSTALLKRCGLRRGFEASRDNYSLDAISAKSRMNAIKLIHSTDELRLNRRVLRLKWPSAATNMNATNPV